MLEIKNHKQVANQIDRWLAQVEKTATETAKGLVAEVFEKFLDYSPQYTGDFAASWNVSINKIDYSFEGFPGEMPVRTPFSVGNPQAIAVAKWRNAGTLANFKLGDTVYLSNAAAHDEPYALKIWNGQIQLRPENQGRTIEDARNYLVKYSGWLGPNTVRKLRNKTI